MGAPRTAAQRALQDELQQCRGERTELLRSRSRFSDAADVRMGKIKERREDSTVDTYRHWLGGVVLPQLGELRLYERDVAHIGAFFTGLKRAPRAKHTDRTSTEEVRYSANTGRTIRSIVAGILQQAVLHKALPSNPVRELERIRGAQGPAQGAAAA